MKAIKWKRIPDYLSVSTVKIECGGCSGFAVYTAISSKEPLPGNPCAVFSPCIDDTCRFFAVENHTSSWCRPFWGESLSLLPGRTQLLVIEESGVYTAFLPVCDSICKTVIRGGGEGAEFAVLSNVDGMTEIPEQLSFLVMQGGEPLALLRAIAEKAAGLLGGLKMREERAMPRVFEYLGWCSWDALQIRVNEADLVRKAEEFAAEKVPVGFAVIDDMWADVPSLNEIPADASFSEMVDIMHESRLRSFSGDKKRFPHGMKNAVESMKKAGCKNVGIWFPATGYWSGLEPGGEADNLLTGLTAVTESGRILISPKKEKAKAAFDLLCGRVKEWGADFVKIDNQGFHKHYHNIGTFGESADAVHSAIDSAVEKYFDGAVINCMGMPNECMFHRTKSAVSRCSDDFLPDNREWFFRHILQCSFNGLLQGQYYINDWDMWWTDDAQAVKNAVCRAVSGGPVYVSDKLGRTRAEILKPLCLADGKILSCDCSAVPAADCLFENPTGNDRIFKIRNTAAGSGIVAVFNINAAGTPVSGSVSPCDAGLPEGRYAFFELFTKKAGILHAGEKVSLSLENNDEFRLFSFVPMPGDIAVIGRTDKYIGIKAVSAVTDDTVLMAEEGETGFVTQGGYRFVNELTGEELPVKRDGVLSVVTAGKIRFIKS